MLDQSTIDSLENKLSEMLADNGNIKSSNIQLAKENKEAEVVIESLSNTINELSTRLSVLEIDNQFLEKCLTHKEKDNHVSIYEYEKVKSELDMASNQLGTLKIKISSLISEKNNL